MKRTIEQIKQEALLYKHKVDFKRGSNPFYQDALRYDRIQRGVMNEICTHMIPKGTWYKKLLYTYVFSDNTIYIGITNDRDVRKWEHQQPNSKVSRYINKTGLKPVYEELTDYQDVKLTLEMEKNLIHHYKEIGWNVLNATKGGENGGGEEFLTKDVCKKEASKYKYRWEFGTASPSHYNKARKRKWLDEICLHMEDKLTDWDEQKILDTAKNSGLTLIKDFARIYSGAYQAVKRLGIKDELRKVFIWKGGKTWTFDEIKEIASKYQYRSHFDKENHAACVYSQNKGWYNDVTSHMGFLPKGKKWTKEEVHEEALKYKTRTEFARTSNTKGANKAYQAASHNGWLDEVCSHMVVAKFGKIGKRK